MTRKYMRECWEKSHKACEFYGVIPYQPFKVETALGYSLVFLDERADEGVVEIWNQYEYYWSSISAVGMNFIPKVIKKLYPLKIEKLYPSEDWDGEHYNLSVGQIQRYWEWKEFLEEEKGWKYEKED